MPPATAPSASEIAGVLDQLAEDSDRMLLAVGRSTVPVSNLDKPLWPGRRRPFTKRDLLVYLARVSPHLLRHLGGRPVFVTRYPHGVEEKSFYQKVWDDPPAFVHSVPVWSAEHGEARPYLLVRNLATLLWLGQQAALELHVWFSRTSAAPDGKRLGTDYASGAEALEVSRLNFPDFLVVDLDAYAYRGTERAGAEPELHRRGFNRTREIAFEVRRVAEALGLEAFVKTSGRTGLHVFLPIARTFPFDEVRAMAQTVGYFLQALRPHDVTLAWSVRERTGKVFFDYNQNARGKSLAAAYSPRRHPAGTVSMPVTWVLLPYVYPTDFTLETVPDLLDERGDAWASILDAKGDLEAVLALGEPGPTT
jgi:bifunctional non-homologous end joining protein LigD